MFKKCLVLFVCVLFVSGLALAGTEQDAQAEQSLYEKILQDNAAEKNKKYSYLYDTSLVQSIKRQDVDRVKFLLLANVNPNEKNDEDELPLIIACKYPSEEIIINLLDRGARVNERAKYGITPLMSAAALGTGRIVNILLEYGANPNLQDDGGRTALMHAVENLNYDTASVLLDLRKLDLTLTDKKDNTAFMYAVNGRDANMLVLFLQKGVNIGDKDKGAQKLFIKSIKNKDFVTANLLLGYGLTLDKDNNDGVKNLIKAVKSDDVESATLLLRAGINPDVKDALRTPVLTYAVKKGNLKMAEALLSHRANPNIKDVRGTVPLTYAINNGDNEMKELLMYYGAQSKETYAIDFTNWSDEDIKNYIERSENNLIAAKAALKDITAGKKKAQDTATLKEKGIGAINFSSWSADELNNYIERSEYNLNAAKEELSKRTVTEMKGQQNLVCNEQDAEQIDFSDWTTKDLREYSKCLDNTARAVKREIAKRQAKTAAKNKNTAKNTGVKAAAKPKATQAAGKNRTAQTSQNKAAQPKAAPAEAPRVNSLVVTDDTPAPQQVEQQAEPQAQQTEPQAPQTVNQAQQQYGNSAEAQPNPYEMPAEQEYMPGESAAAAPANYPGNPDEQADTGTYDF